MNYTWEYGIKSEIGRYYFIAASIINGINGNIETVRSSGYILKM